MSRPRYKFNYISRTIWKQNLNIVSYYRWFYFKHINIFSKNSLILPMFNKRIMGIHKGNLSKRIVISPTHIYKKFGSFVLTRKPFFFPIKVKKKKK